MSSRGVVVAAVCATIAACSSSSHSGPSDASIDGASDAGMPDDALAADVVEEPNPTSLRQTGLYEDFAAKKVSSTLVAFTPAHVLWSDGAVKSRWIRLPAGTTIDTSDMDHWRFPVGTKLFKEFALDGKRLETRLIWRRSDTGHDETDFWVGAFVWNDDESDAVLAPDGANDLRGTDHDAPAQKQCWACHLGDAGHVLGFSAVQLAPTIDALAARGWLSSPPAPGTDLSAPNAALGYLHANCGHCHNENGIAWPDTQMVLRLSVAERTAAATRLVQTTVGVPLQRWQKTGFQYRIAAGDPAASGLLYRMTQRDPSPATRDQMPPVATEHADDAGVAAITAWIQRL